MWAYNCFDQYNIVEGMPLNLTCCFYFLLLEHSIAETSHCAVRIPSHVERPTVGAPLLQEPTHHHVFTLLKGLTFLPTPSLAHFTHPSNLKLKIISSEMASFEICQLKGGTNIVICHPTLRFQFIVLTIIFNCYFILELFLISVSPNKHVTLKYVLFTIMVGSF